MMRRRAVLPCLALLLLFGSAPAAQATVAIESFTYTATTTQAGAHADLSTSFSLEKPGEPETAKDALIDLPPGAFIYAESVPRCSSTQFSLNGCPVNSQVGVVTVRGTHEGNPNYLLGTAPVYLLGAEEGELGRLGFAIPTVDIPVVGSLRVPAGENQSLQLAFEDLPQSAPLKSLALTLWGVPAAPEHDEQRFPGEPRSCPGSEDTSCIPFGGAESNVSQAPFTRNPTSCNGATSAALAVDSHQHPGEFASTSSSIVTTGCGKLTFSPSLNVSLTSTETSSPTGLGVQVKMPVDFSPKGLSGSDLEALALYLSLALDKGAAATHEVCTSAQAHLDGSGAVECPPGSSVGALTIALPDTGELEGQVYFGGGETQHSYRLFLVASGIGIDLRLPASLFSDAETAELILPSLPQIPVKEFLLSLDQTSGLFRTPPECGKYETAAELAPWKSSSSRWIAHPILVIGSGPKGGPCPGSEAPVQPAPSASVVPPTPTVSFRHHPPHRTRDRTPTFRFASSVPGSSFKCGIDQHRMRACESPFTLPRLGFGTHTFKVVAVAAGVRSQPLSYAFVVRR
jgi:hypothetical protein